MSYYTARTTYGTTGIKTINCGFQPAGMRLTVAGKASSSTVVQFSQGVSDGTRQSYESLYSDSTGRQTKDGNTKMISHWERIAGVLTEVYSVAFDSFTATEGKFNIGTVSNNYSIKIELWD